MTALETEVPAPAEPAVDDSPAFDGYGPFVLAFTLFAVVVVIIAVLKA